jgi:acyl carrier protein
MERFLELVAEILEVDPESISMDTDFRNDVDGWDSMKGFSIICMIEDEYQVQIDVPSFLRCRTVGDLYAKAVGDH